MKLARLSSRSIWVIRRARPHKVPILLRIQKYIDQVALFRKNMSLKVGISLKRNQDVG